MALRYVPAIIVVAATFALSAVSAADTTEPAPGGGPAAEPTTPASAPSAAPQRAPGPSPHAVPYPYPYAYPYPAPYGYAAEPPRLPPPPPTRQSSPALVAGGIVASTAGTIVLISGVVLFAAGRGAIPIFCDDGRRPFECSRRDDSTRVIGGVALMIGGGALALGGIPMVVAGSKRVPLETKPKVARRMTALRVGPASASLDVWF